MSLREMHEQGDCWAPCVWCYEDEALAERDEDSEDEVL